MRIPNWLLYRRHFAYPPSIHWPTIVEKWRPLQIRPGPLQCGQCGTVLYRRLRTPRPPCARTDIANFDNTETKLRNARIRLPAKQTNKEQIFTIGGHFSKCEFAISAAVAEVAIFALYRSRSRSHISPTLSRNQSWLGKSLRFWSSALLSLIIGRRDWR